MPLSEILKLHKRRRSDVFYTQIPRSGKNKTSGGASQVIVRWRRRVLSSNFGSGTDGMSNNGQRRHSAVAHSSSSGWHLVKKAPLQSHLVWRTDNWWSVGVMKCMPRNGNSDERWSTDRWEKSGQHKCQLTTEKALSREKEIRHKYLSSHTQAKSDAYQSGRMREREPFSCGATCMLYTCCFLRVHAQISIWIFFSPPLCAFPVVNPHLCCPVFYPRLCTCCLLL